MNATIWNDIRRYRKITKKCQNRLNLVFGDDFFDFEENECDDMGRYPTISKNRKKNAKID